MREEHIAEIFHITKRQVSNWNIAGCPKGPKGYDLYHVILWYVKREAEKNAPKYDSEAQNVEGPVSLKDKKTLEEIAVLQRRQEKMDFEMQELKDTTIPKDVHKRSVSAVIEAFVSFLRNSLKRNVASFRAVPDVEANDMIDKFCIDLTQHMANSARQAERV
jgi:phage terminase Nu1 subunit (DNA packaging protein)